MPQSDKYLEVDWGFGARLRTLREARGMTAAQLAEKSGVAERTVQLLEAGGQRRPRRNTLALLATATGFQTVQSLIEAKPAVPPASEATFGQLLKLVRDIDAYLIALVRDHRHASSQLLSEEHRDLVRARLADAGLPLDGLLAMLEDPAALRHLCNSLPEPDLVLTVGPEFEWQTFESAEHHVRVEHPLLLWDCHCKTPGSQAGPDSCPIHSQPGGAAIADAMANGHVEIRWQTLRIRWQRDIALWPPAIDSFLMMNDMHRSGVLKRSGQRVIDLGSGTGFLAAAIAFQAPSVSHITVADWLLMPLLFSTVNCALNFGDDRRLKVSPKLAIVSATAPRLALGLEGADLAICNPPYLPLLPGFESLGQHSTVAGTDLLACVIRRARQIARTTVVQFSHLADSEASQAADGAGLRLIPLGEEREVPFRVLHALERSGYVEALQRERDLVVREDDRHRYWHRLRTFSVVPK